MVITIIERPGALSQTWAPVEADPATEDFVAVTKSDLKDLTLHGGVGGWPVDLASGEL